MRIVAPTDYQVDASSAVEAAGPARQFNDKFINRQWYLDDSSLSHLSIDIYQVWQEYTGKGVKVGVIDTQIDFRHPELARAYDTGLDFNFATNTANVVIDPANLPHYHGTFVAGMISAQVGNGQGTAGIADGATLVGLAVDYSSDGVVSQILAALDAAVKVDVVNNSWRFVSIFGDDFRRNPEYGNALAKLATEGREGLGTNIVFAAGNQGASGSSNYNNFQNSPFSIAVGAVSADGTPARFTSLGANVLLSAAGREVISTDPDGKFDEGSGTSYAAPQVSGVIALMLEANAELGYRDVQQILALSARREGLSDMALHGDGWQVNGATNHNGGGMHFSDAFGFGYLNAHDAVRLAESWTMQQTAANRAEFSREVKVGQTMVAGSTDRIAVDIEITQAMQVEHVQVALDFAWRFTADIDVWLVSPEGTRVRLVYDLPEDSGVGGLRGFKFSSVASMGELAAGTWRIEIVNNNPAAKAKNGTPEKGLLDDIAITLLGRSTGLTDDTYVYTDEFATLYTGDELAARKLLVDGDGGTDTLNAAALTSASVIDLSGTIKSVLAGHTVDIGKGEIENAFGGDGNDVLTGSVKANVIKAGRGDDALHFSGGNDLLDGQQGSDTLFVNARLADLTGYVTRLGEVALSAAAGTVSIIRNVERYVFADATYTAAQLLALLTSDSGTGGGDDDGAGDGGGSSGGGDDTGGGNGGTGDGDGDGGTLPDPFGYPDREYARKLTGNDTAETLRSGRPDTLIEGLGGDDYLVGSFGDDELRGGDGLDKLRGGTGDDFLFGDAGNDKLMGDTGNDRLAGGTGRDDLYGGAGNDILRGGRGADFLKGGLGADTFVFDLADLDGIDVISDFNSTEGDRILITGLGGAGEDDFQFVTRGRHTILQMKTDKGLVDIAQIQGGDVDGLQIMAGDGGLYFA